MVLDDNVLENIVNNPESPREHALAKALLVCHDEIRRLQGKVDEMALELIRRGFLPPSGGMMLMLNTFLSRTPDVCGGEPVVAGTRISVSHLWRLHSMGKGLSDIVLEYPQLSLAQVDAAIEYAKDHLELQKSEEDEEDEGLPSDL